MFRNYFKTGLRNLLKYKFFSLINILGLVTGVTAAVFIYIYIIDELGYDRFHEHIDRMYRVGLHARVGGQEVNVFATCPPLARAMADEIPEVAQSCRLWEWSEVVMRYEDKVFTESDIFLVDSNFFHFFSFELLEGDPVTVLREPRSIVMTSSMAEKYFGNAQAVGNLITVGNDNETFVVTGVVRNPPNNSHIKFNFLYSISSNDFPRSDQWLSNSMQTYFIVHPGSRIEAVQQKLDEMVVKYVGPALSQFMGISVEEFIAQEGAYGYLIDAVKDVHLKGRLQAELEPPGDIRYVYIFAAIGFFIMLIAAINYMNLATARSAGRAKEVGLRKTFGSYRSQLIGQFLVESLLYTIIATILSILLVYILLPQFNFVSGKAIDFESLQRPEILLGVLAIAVLIGLFSGLYPAFYLTRFQVSTILKGQLAQGMRGGLIRSALVVFQFGISIFLIIGTLLVYRQLQYTQTRNLGFNRENVLIVSNTRRLQNNREAFQNRLKSESEIIAASYSNSVIPGTNNTTVFRRDGSEEDHIIAQYFADYDQVAVLGYELSEGRNFSQDFPSDSMAILVNEACVKEVGWERPIGEYLLGFDGNEPRRLQVIGVLRDFNFESLRENIRPLVIQLGNFGNQMTIRFSGANPAETVGKVESIWQELAPGEPFEYAFLDQRFDELYRTEQRLGRLFTIFTSIAIFIACLGLFGLAAFTAEQRTREIGIRKAMGASTFTIIRLLSAEFARFVLIAFLLAIVPAWLFIGNWLSGFVYRTEYGPGIFLLGGLAALLISQLTVSYQSVRAAMTNPSQALRYE
jgi:putative ABC transport system permease protein